MKDDRSDRWFVRVTAPYEHTKSKYAELKSQVDVVCSAIGYHVGSKTGKAHCHIVLHLRQQPQKQSLDVRLKKLFDVKGADYSSKIWDGSHKVLSYLYHDKNGSVEVNMPLTDEQKAEITRTAEVYETIVEQAKTKSSGRIVDNILAEMGDEDWSQSRIIDAILDGVHAGKWHKPGDFQIVNYVDEIRLKVKDEASWTRNKGYIRHRILKRLED